MIDRLASPTDFGAFLTGCAIRFEYESQSRIFSLYGRPEDPAPTVFVEWLQGTGAVRVFTWVLREIPEDRLVDVAWCVARINHGLLVPGFILDTERRWVAWRGAALLDRSGAISSDVPSALIHLAVRSSHQFYATLAGAAALRHAEPAPGEPPAWAGEP